ncbi:sorting nexin-6-like [Gracilinanus agilis]|uniref:sorting nexin-6-like n=1 Tax=Gracilinanus agilis TaxID=191870 RepID=UPI001CFE7BBA|nr:sorting nexin-6-like [Gracilinanus agilis]
MGLQHSLNSSKDFQSSQSQMVRGSLTTARKESTGVCLLGFVCWGPFAGAWCKPLVTLPINRSRAISSLPGSYFEKSYFEKSAIYTHGSPEAIHHLHRHKKRNCVTLEKSLNGSLSLPWCYARNCGDTDQEDELPSFFWGEYRHTNESCTRWAVTRAREMAQPRKKQRRSYLQMDESVNAYEEKLYSFHKHLLSFCYGPSTVLDTRNPKRKERKKEERAPRAINVDLQSDAALQVDISDALSERDKVKFTVHTKSSLPNFKQNEFSVVRQHEEFIWLHDSFVENEDYASYIIPPAPPRPDFHASREKLQKLGEGEGSMTKEEFTKMKQELEAEYLAIFKKTVAMHEVFLCRVAAHPILRKDLNLHVFLEYNQDLSVHGKNKKEKLEDFFKNMVKSADGVIVSGVKDVDDFFEHERTFLLEYHNRVKDASAKSDRMTRSHKSAADDYNRIGSSLYALGTQDSTDICKFFLKVSELFDKTWKIEARVSADEDLKLSDLLKYYLRESQAAKDLLYRRCMSLVDYENANKALDKARAKNKDVLQAGTSQQVCCQKFEKISEFAKQELIDFKTRRVAAFRKNLVELAELELKHAKGNLQLLQSCLAVLNGDI